ncbi:unnamed protein product, partial [Porites evermanni]
MGDHITKTSSAAFYYLYNIRRIRKYLSKESYRIVFKILLLTFKAIHKLAPTYISELVSPKDTGGRYYLRSNNGKLL